MTARTLTELFGRSRRGRRSTVTCPTCDVTWRGTVDDACWSCGQQGHAVVAAAPPVRLRS